jgi:uncharacterized protein YodC (DUF2158 family)
MEPNKPEPKFKPGDQVTFRSSALPDQPTPVFKPGDVVQLLSGHPKMTVNEILPTGGVSCSWFSRDSEVMHGVFPPEYLGMVLALTDSGSS